MPALESANAANSVHIAPAGARHSQAGFSARVRPLLAGLALSGLIAYASIALGDLGWMQAHGLSALMIAIVLGIALGNTVYPRLAGNCHTGVTFSKQTLLRLGIILYGFRLTFQDIGQVGFAGVAIDALVLTSTFALAMLLGTRLFKLDRNTALLIGAGSSICGAAAVMAVEPVLKGRTEQVTVAVSTVVVFGTLAIFLYPLLYRLNLDWHLVGTAPASFGVYIGSTVHEVAQVVAAGHAIDQDAANAAVIAKMVRVMMLAPFLLILSTWLARRDRSSGAAVARGRLEPPARLAIPWFVFAFIAVVGFNSLFLLPHPVVAGAIAVDTMLLAMAMAALGLTTHVSAIRRAGVKPLILAAILFCWLIAGGATINRSVMAWLG
ncbi:YeiH family protein [Herminiimonas sp. CN]|uniref:YeiH family protein n=1 Tax=Herminiimonas sp. CN TaxID=1349818 RepID=UPI000550E490|nr:YeiH family protein [Herminiimonas sp. CN]